MSDLIITNKQTSKAYVKTKNGILFLGGGINGILYNVIVYIIILFIYNYRKKLKN